MVRRSCRDDSVQRGDNVIVVSRSSCAVLGCVVAGVVSFKNENCLALLYLR